MYVRDVINERRSGVRPSQCRYAGFDLARGSHHRHFCCNWKVLLLCLEKLYIFLEYSRNVCLRYLWSSHLFTESCGFKFTLYFNLFSVSIYSLYYTVCRKGVLLDLYIIIKNSLICLVWSLYCFMSFQPNLQFCRLLIINWWVGSTDSWISLLLRQFFISRIRVSQPRLKKFYHLYRFCRFHPSFLQPSPPCLDSSIICRLLSSM